MAYHPIQHAVPLLASMRRSTLQLVSNVKAFTRYVVYTWFKNASITLNVLSPNSQHQSLANYGMALPNQLARTSRIICRSWQCFPTSLNESMKRNQSVVGRYFKSNSSHPPSLQDLVLSLFLCPPGLLWTLHLLHRTLGTNAPDNASPLVLSNRGSRHPVQPVRHPSFGDGRANTFPVLWSSSV